MVLRRPPTDFYVYQYVRSVASSHGPVGSPYYVGKGRGKRAYRKGDKEIRRPREKEYIVIVASGLQEHAALAIERQLIASHGRIDRGTGCLRNRTDGGESNAGAIRTAEMKARVSAVHKGLRHSEDAKAKMSQSRLGLRHSGETKARIGSAHRGRKNGPMSEDVKSRISLALKGRPKSEEWKAMISESNRRRVISQETKDKIATSLTGKKRSEASRTKQSLSNKGKVPHNKGKTHSEETRAKMSAAQKRIWDGRNESHEKANIVAERQLRSHSHNFNEEGSHSFN